LALLTLVACLPWLGAQSAPAAQADLWQARNGTPTAPLDPVDWVKGNVGQANSHYVEGYSAPYRLVMSGLALGPHRVVIEWDTQQGGKHGIDYLTHYERMRPHNQFGAHDRPETVDPLAGLSGTFAAPRAFPAPLPSSSDSPIPGQPGKSFLALPAAERVLTIWNGAITNAAYLQEGPLTSPAAAAQLAIEFVAESDTVVLAWGGHLATKTDWGAGFSAADISGSAYHMRKIDLDGSGGNQDRSLQALAVVSPPTCVINGPTSICTLATNVFAATSDDSVAGFIWTLTNNLAGASFVSATNQASVEVVATSPGTFTLQATAVDGMSQSACFFEVTVYATVAAGSLGDQTVCDGSEMTFVIQGSGSDLTYTWRKDGRVLPDAKTSTLILRDVHAADAGSYCVEIGGRCGQQTRCASLFVEALPMLACPEEVVRPCITELPGPDPALARVLAGSAPVVVRFGGDVTNIQDGDVTVTRTYQAVDACGQRTSCTQRLIARDRTPPQIDCPGDLIVREEPANSGFATIVYSDPTVTDSCDPAPMVVCDPPSGAAFAVGDTLVQCRATDSAGNLGQCGFRVRVVPQTIVVTSLADSGPGSLRQAMLDANAAAGSNTIAFGFPGAAPYTIQVLSALPGVSDRLIIDGQSQPTFAGSPVVELNGVAAPAAGGAAAGPIAAAAAAPAVDGLLLASGGNVVRGLVLYGFTFGIRVDGSSNNIIAGNIIGPDHTGTNPIGNRLDGILLTGGASDNRIGPNNLIAFNGRNGVGLDATAGSGNTVLSNRIVFNGALPIDLGNDGPTPNDADDPDLGPNGLQNSPVLAQVRSDGFTQLIIPGTLQGPPFTLFRIDFFLEQLAPTGDPRDAQNPIGSAEVRTDASGLARFEATFSFSARPGQYITATATDASGSTSEQAARSPVRTPPIILDPPHGVTTPLGGPAELCVEAIGTEPLVYQWRRNGANIADATNVCFIIGSAVLSDGATYTVVVANELDAITSDPALVLLDLPQLKAGDNFADRVPLFGPAGMISFTNAAATREPGEPLHAGKSGEHSVWYTWTPPANGIATLRTVGSTFDTLLAVYLGEVLTNLEVLAADEDRGGYFTSEVRFNAVGGLPYQIAVDGLGNNAGHFTFSWDLFVTDVVLPVITNQPVSQTVLPAGTAIFQVGAVAGCKDGHHDCRHPDKDHHEQHPDDVVPVFYQWLLNGVPLIGATNATLIIANAGDADLGNYTVRVREGTNVIESLSASLQLNLTGSGFVPLQAVDKFFDAANSSAPLHLGTPPGGGSGPDLGAQNPFAAASIVRGYTGTQVFNTSGSTTEGELICGVLGGASEWISLVPEESGTLFLNTDGSSFDTVLAVFRRSATNASRLELVACDNDGGIDHHDSALQITAQAGQTNFIVIDGVNGAHGTLRLNYSLVTPSALSLIGLVSQQPGRIRVVGHPSMRFILQTSSNLVDWTLLLTTNSGPAIYEFIDPSSVNVPRRYYRALMLP
jgi:hypothetical protein